MRAFHIIRSLPWKRSHGSPTLEQWQEDGRLWLTGQIAIGTAASSAAAGSLSSFSPFFFIMLRHYRSHLNIQWSLTTVTEGKEGQRG